MASLARLAKSKISCYFLLTIPLAWMFWIPMILVAHGILVIPIPFKDMPQIAMPGVDGISPILIILSTLGGISPLISLAIVGKVFGNPFSLDNLFKQMRIKNARKGWLVASILIIPLVTIAGNVIGFATGSEANLQVLAEGPGELGWWLALIIPVQFTAALFTSPLFEEPGWRGFALVELEKRFPRELASLMLGSYWWLWHQGMNLAFGEYPSLRGYVSMIAMSFVIDSLYNLSNRSLLAAMLAHQASGTSIVFLRNDNRNLATLAVMIGTAMVLRIIESRYGSPGRFKIESDDRGG